MTMLHIKTSGDLQTSFASMPDSFSTRPEGKIPTSRQVFKALFTLYYTLLFGMALVVSRLSNVNKGVRI